jgi:hypothetical protein
MKTNEMSAAVYEAILSMEELKEPVKIDGTFKPARLSVLILSQIIESALEKGKENGSDLLNFVPTETEELKKICAYLLEKAKLTNLAEKLKNLK